MFTVHAVGVASEYSSEYLQRPVACLQMWAGNDVILDLEMKNKKIEKSFYFFNTFFKTNE